MAVSFLAPTMVYLNFKKSLEISQKGLEHFGYIVDKFSGRTEPNIIEAELTSIEFKNNTIIRNFTIIVTYITITYKLK